MAAATAKRAAPKSAHTAIRRIALAATFVCAACNGALLNLDGTTESQSVQSSTNGAPATTAISQMSTAVAIRDAACYSDFELANAAIVNKLSESIRNITMSGDVGENTMRGEMILGLRFNANLQKRLAFDTLEECLR